MEQKITDNQKLQKANVRDGFLAMIEKFSDTAGKSASVDLPGENKEYRFTPNGSEEEARSLAPLTLAFLGDAVYELYVRTMLVQRGDMRPNELNRRSSLLARAHAQSDAMGAIEPVLDETEADIYRRGRNAKSHTMAKNATVADYRRATGFEALIGYLYLAGKQDRLEELIRIAIAKNGQ